MRKKLSYKDWAATKNTSVCMSLRVGTCKPIHTVWQIGIALEFILSIGGRRALCAFYPDYSCFPILFIS